jgi:hypothetical protein
MRARIGNIMAGMVAAGIIVVGARFLFDPRGAARSYGVPLDSDGDRWLTAVKGVRDVTSGLLLAAAMSLPGRAAARRMLSVATIIPVADGAIVAARYGARRPGILAMHWGTAAFMAAGAALLR